MLRVKDGLVEELSRCLRLEDGELPLEPLPELQRLTYLELAIPVMHSPHLSIPARSLFP
jgi:hypothetical protein